MSIETWPAVTSPCPTPVAEMHAVYAYMPPVAVLPAYLFLAASKSTTMCSPAYVTYSTDGVGASV